MMCVAATNSTTFAIPFPFSTIANEQKHRPRASLHHLPYAYELVRIHRSYTVYGIFASCVQSHLIIRWGIPLLYVGRIHYYISLCPYPYPYPCPLYPLYIYVETAIKDCPFLYLYIQLYIYDFMCTISVDCAGATLVALLYIYVIRIRC